MNKFKIKINCTHPNELKIDNYAISKNSQLYNYIRSKMQLENIDYITKMLIVYKKDSNKIETRTIEFLINREIDENEFILFIVKMKDAGFFSLNNRDILFIETDITTDKPKTISDKPKSISDKPKSISDKPKSISDKPKSKTIFNRNFTSVVKVPIRQNGNFINTSTYNTEVIYEI
jgi:hypothetical protein